MVEMLVGKDDIVKRQVIRLDIVTYIGLHLRTWIYDNTALVCLVDEQVGVRRHRYIIEPQDLNVIAEYILHRW